MSAVIFLRDVGRLLRWEPPSSYIALPMVQRMRMRAGSWSPTLEQRYAMFWLFVPDLIAGWLLRKTWPTCRIDGWGAREPARKPW